MNRLNVRWDRVRFGVFEADLRSGELRKHGMRIRLQALPFKLLAVLLERPGEVVSKEELKERLWGTTAVGDFDHSLGTAIKKIRETFDDSAESPRYIETLARRGYRFIAPVEGIGVSRSENGTPNQQASTTVVGIPLHLADTSSKSANSDVETMPKPEHANGEILPEAATEKPHRLADTTSDTDIPVTVMPEPAQVLPRSAAPDEGCQTVSSRWRSVAILLGTLLLTSVTFIMFGARLLSRTATLNDSVTPDAVTRNFWNAFLSRSDLPWVVFSNAAFVGTPDKGMRYYRPNVDPPQHVLEHYTGVGEVLSIHELDQTFGTLGYRIRIKRGALLSMDDVKDRSLIFVGAPVENPVLNDIPTMRDFKFQVVSSGPRQGDVAVVDLHPAPGELSLYINSPDKPIIDDYAIIALFPGINQQRSILLAAGTTTIGTQAAVEYICHTNTLTDLLQRLGKDSDKPFEAVLHVQVARGVPVDAQIVALHKTSVENHQAFWQKERSLTER